MNHRKPLLMHPVEPCFCLQAKNTGYILVIGLSQGGAYFNRRISLASTLNGEEEER